MWLYEKLAAEWRIIKAAPFSVMTIMVVMAIALWLSFSWIFAQRIDGLKEALSSKDSVLADYRDKLKGATPAEARTRLDALELQVAALSPRRLSEGQKQDVSQAAKAAKGSTIDILSDAAVADARSFTKDLALAFQQADWTVRLPMLTGGDNPSATGVALRVKNPAHLTLAETAAKNALEAGRIAFDVQPASNFGPPLPEAILRYRPEAAAEIYVTVRGPSPASAARP